MSLDDDTTNTSASMSRLNISEQYSNHTIDELKQLYIDKSIDAIIMCLNPDMDRNIGNIIRTASASFFKKCVIIGRKRVNLKSSVGMNHYVPIEYVQATLGYHNQYYDFEKIISYLEEISKTHIIVFIELHKDSISLKNMNTLIKKSGKPPAFLVGNEGSGIPVELLECDKFDKIIVQIPMNGFVRSYNVSNSFAMIYWEYIRDL